MGSIDHDPLGNEAVLENKIHADEVGRWNIISKLLMHKSAKVILMIGVIWLILTCGCGFFTMFRPGIATRWQQEPAPPEKVIRLGLGDGDGFEQALVVGNEVPRCCRVDAFFVCHRGFQRGS